MREREEIRKYIEVVVVLMVEVIFGDGTYPAHVVPLVEESATANLKISSAAAELAVLSSDESETSTRGNANGCMRMCVISDRAGAVVVGPVLHVHEPFFFEFPTTAPPKGPGKWARGYLQRSGTR